MEEEYNYTIYCRNTGCFKRNLRSPTEKNAIMNTKDDEILVNEYHSDSSYVDLINHKVKKTNSRKTFQDQWDFENKEWYTKKEDIYISKTDLITNLVKEGYIDRKEISNIMTGSLPNKVDIQADSETVEFEVKLKVWWNQIKQVPQKHECSQFIQKSFKITNSKWNKLFEGKS